MKWLFSAVCVNVLSQVEHIGKGAFQGFGVWPALLSICFEVHGAHGYSEAVPRFWTQVPIHFKACEP